MARQGKEGDRRPPQTTKQLGDTALQQREAEGARSDVPQVIRTIQTATAKSTASEIKKARREEAERRRKGITRRRLLMATAATGVLLATGAAAYIGNERREEEEQASAIPPLTPILDPAPSLDDDPRAPTDIIIDELRKKEIKPNIPELQLWKPLYEKSSAEDPKTPAEKQNATITRTADTLVTMKNSSIDPFRLTSQAALAAHDDGSGIKPLVILPAQLEPSDYVEVVPSRSTDGEKGQVQLSINETTVGGREFEPLHFALTLTWGISEAANILKYQGEKAGTTALLPYEQTLALERQRRTDTERFTHDKAISYGVMAEASLQFVAALGTDQVKGFPHAVLASEYIKSGRDPLSEQWKQYVSGMVSQSKII